MALRAIDVSRWQGRIDWGAVEADASIGAVSIQLSFGQGGVDPMGAANWQATAANGKPRVAYHFAYPAGPNNVDDARAQAQHFFSCIQAAGGLRPQDEAALDLEEASGNLSAEWAIAFLNELRSLTGRLPGFYSDPNCIYGQLAGGRGIGDVSWLWLAAYQANEPLTPPGWSAITWWQDRSTAVEQGVSGQVDEDIVEQPFPGAVASSSPFLLIPGVL